MTNFFVSPNSDALFEVDELTEEVTSTFQNAATVAVTVEDISGTEVISSQAVAYVAASDGKYQATLDKALFASFTRGRYYVAKFTAVESGLDREFAVTFKFDYEA